MFQEAASAATAVRVAAAGGCGRHRLHRRRPSTAGAAGRNHLRTRQLRSCGHLRQISDRNARQNPHGVRGTLGEFGVRHKSGSEWLSVHCHLAIRTQPGSAGIGRRCQGFGRNHFVLVQQPRLAADRRIRFGHRTTRGTREQCRRDQILSGDTGSHRATGGRMDPGSAAECGA